MRKRIPSMSSRKLVRLLEGGGAMFVRQGKTDHAIYERVVGERVYRTPVQMGKQTISSVRCLQIFRQLGFTDGEIEQLLE
jgi:predicted RNA binding protein YcfA (HicA-like mRNA interferase family)